MIAFKIKINNHNLEETMKLGHSACTKNKKDAFMLEISMTHRHTANNCTYKFCVHIKSQPSCSWNKSMI